MSRRWVDEVEREVIAAGGSVSVSADGHLKVFDREGRYCTKVRAAGKDAGDNQGATGRSVLRQVLRRVEEGGTNR